MRYAYFETEQDFNEFVSSYNLKGHHDWKHNSPSFYPCISSFDHIYNEELRICDRVEHTCFHLDTPGYVYAVTQSFKYEGGSCCGVALTFDELRKFLQGLNIKLVSGMLHFETEKHEYITVDYFEVGKFYGF